MKTNTKVDPNFIGPMMPRAKKVGSNKVKTMNPPVLYLVPTKLDIQALYDADILALEDQLKELKALKLELFGKQFNYKVPKNQGVGSFIRDQILLGLGNTDILRLVEAKFENNNTTYACVAWYRNDMKKMGLI
jgi:hypothetical protein